MRQGAFPHRDVLIFTERMDKPTERPFTRWNVFQLHFERVFFCVKTFWPITRVAKKWPRKVNNLTDSPHGICELSIAFTEVQRINNIHCFIEFPWLLLFKPIRSLVQTTFLNWNIFSSWRSPLNCLSLQYYWCRLSVYLPKTFYCALWREISWPSAQKGDWKPGFT